MQVRYAHAPRPEYPEQARREGKEGRVMLRVLVDEQGRSTSVEVNQSSGSETLDMAAIEAIKRWRFWPARYDNVPVESWVRIPVEFRLSDAKHQVSDKEEASNKNHQLQSDVRERGDY